jgi:predicted nucleic acid-binding protein
MSAEFADTNVVLYLLDDGPKADRAEDILGQGPRISVQVLNEAMDARLCGAKICTTDCWSKISYAS